MHYILNCFDACRHLQKMLAGIEHHKNEIVVKYTDAYISLLFKSTMIRK